MWSVSFAPYLPASTGVRYDSPVAAKPTKPDGLEVLLSWPQGSAAEVPTTRSRKARPAPAHSQPDASTSAEEVVLYLGERLDRFESEMRSRIDELAERVEELASAQSGDIERVLKGLEAVRRRLPVTARAVTAKPATSPAPPAEDPGPASTPPGGRLHI